jgi:hypothetical protein
MLKRAPSMRMIQQVSDVKRVLTCPLTKKVTSSCSSVWKIYGIHVVFFIDSAVQPILIKKHIFIL